MTLQIRKLRIRDSLFKKRQRPCLWVLVHSQDWAVSTPKTISMECLCLSTPHFPKENRLCIVLICQNKIRQFCFSPLLWDLAAQTSSSREPTQSKRQGGFPTRHLPGATNFTHTDTHIHTHTHARTRHRCRPSALFRCTASLRNPKRLAERAFAGLGCSKALGPLREFHG